MPVRVMASLIHVPPAARGRRNMVGSATATGARDRARGATCGAIRAACSTQREES